jgi:head-tail adaptor
MALPAGGRRTRIEVQRQVTEKNALNEDVASWGIVASRLAERLDVSDGERVRAAEVGAVITSRFRVLRDATLRTVTPRDRIVIRDAIAGDRIYDIVGIKEVGRAGFEITAAARADREAEA